MKVVEVYESTDGVIFKTEAECLEHEQSFAVNEDLESFFASDEVPYQSPRSQSMCRSAILSWEKYKVKIKNKVK